MSMSRSRSALIVFTLLTLISAACGSSAELSTTGPAAPSGSAGALATPPAAASSNSAAAVAATQASGAPATGRASPATAAAAPAVTPAISGSASTPAGSAPSTPSTPAVDPTAMGAAPMQPQGAAPVLAMDECGLRTNYPGDNYCIKAPDKDKGWQLHIGPASYENPDAQYILMPGQEVSDSFPTKTTNDKKMFFYYRQFRMRPGAHHNIITVAPAASMPAAGGFNP